MTLDIYTTDGRAHTITHTRKGCKSYRPPLYSFHFILIAETGLCIYRIMNQDAEKKKTSGLDGLNKQLNAIG